MKKFIVHLSREYVVQIDANNEDDARVYSELYVSGGIDESTGIICSTHNFRIQHIKHTLNEAHYVEEM